MTIVFFQGTWADSETEVALKALTSFAKSYGGDRNALENAAVHMKLFEALKKEFKVIALQIIKSHLQLSILVNWPVVVYITFIISKFHYEDVKACSLG